MAINRYELITRHNPVHNTVDTKSPLTVGNGELGFTADITGMQTLYDTYQELPLCTMSQWGWHTTPVSKERYSYTLDDLVMTEYDCMGKTVVYPKSKKPGNEEVYDWLRHNPHRLNLARIALLYEGKEIKSSEISSISQELVLYEGILQSEFKLHELGCHVMTACDPTRDCLAFEISSELLSMDKLSVSIRFPYGSSDITGSDWNNTNSHTLTEVEVEQHRVLVEHTLDRDAYCIEVNTSEETQIKTVGHEILIIPNLQNIKTMSFTVYFSKCASKQKLSAKEVFSTSKNWWKEYWEKGGIVKLNESKDKRAIELERRIILSQYLMAINSAGSNPPQETGLTCNSWYGKMHLEMYLWHCAWLPLWNHTVLLERSLSWYLKHLKEARENAARNGYKGARWPKMIAEEGIDSPSPIAPLLVWQQPHIIFMLELAYQKNKSENFLKKYWELIVETAEFMVDFVHYNEESGYYDIPSPVIPVQECHRPEDTKNPAFEVEYWTVTLKIALKWAQRINKTGVEHWKQVAENMAPMAIKEGLYLSHELCPDTFTKYNKDHPLMTGSYGLINGRIEPKVMKDTLHKIIECWEYQTLWGWDFAMMAMTATRLNEPETVIDILLMDTMKNRYVVSGNNLQESRPDLPLYLPGNGALLLAIPLMTAGYQGCTVKTPGFPKDGNWVVEYENIEPFFE